jgi:ElaB/YqjD/DUF883 family membrane-anchored ribosome-binding protein
MVEDITGSNQPQDLAQSVGGAIRGVADQADLQTIKEDLVRLKDDVASLTRNLFSAGRTGATDVTGRLGGMARQGMDQLSDTFGDVGDRSKQMLDVAQHKVEENPLASVGIAFGVGLLLGSIIRGK